MRLHELYPFQEERKQKKRKGRGIGSGKGGTSTKGHKGQNARSGGGVRAGFEGGQMPLQRRLPKFGFNNSMFTRRYVIFNIADLLKYFPNLVTITVDDIYARGLCKQDTPIKILGEGVLDKAITIQAHAFSKKAKELVISSGGKVDLLGE